MRVLRFPTRSAPPGRRARRAVGACAAVTSIAGLVLALGASPAAAQSAGDGFLFGRPRASLSIRGGFDRARASSEVFDFAQEQLTLDQGDFSSLTAAADLAFPVASRVDVAIGSSYSRSNAHSEFRDFVDQDDLPIEQTTSFTRVPITASAKLYLASRGRELGTLAWVPTRMAPYVGAGGGVMWYQFRQEGDFVDSDDLGVFPADLASEGWTPMAQGFAGVDVTLSPRMALTTEARYTWGRATLGEDFAQFDQIDLSGLAVTAGITFRF